MSVEFGLSEERAQKISKIVSAWSNVKDRRSLNAKDADSFLYDVFGVSFQEFVDAQKALTNNSDSSSMEELINTAAAINEITPERMREIFQAL